MCLGLGKIWVMNMKKLKFALISLVAITFFFISTNDVKAFFCDYSELAKQKQVASHTRYQKNYDFDDEENLYFFIEIYNLRSNHNLLINENIVNRAELEKQNGAYIIPVRDGAVTKVEVGLASDISCDNNNLKTMYVNFPKHNQFHDHEVCSDLRGLRQCDIWFDHNLTEEEFVSLVESRIARPEQEPDDEGLIAEGFLEIIMYYLTNYYYILIGLIVITLIIYKKYQSSTEFDLKTD